eukprot:scaffold11145_cov42-Attheya_sp.AAC.1
MPMAPKIVAVTYVHVMDSMVSHGALVVDLTDGGATYQDALAFARMWNVTGAFFDASEEDKTVALPPMKPAEGAGSKHAM